MLLTEQMNRLLTEFIVRKTFKGSPRIQLMFVSMMEREQSKTLNLAHRYEMAYKYSQAYNVQAIDPYFLTGSEMDSFCYSFTNEELTYQLVPFLFLESLVLTHQAKLTESFKALFKQKNRWIQREFNTWLGNQISVTLDLDMFLAWSEEIVRDEEVEEVEKEFFSQPNPHESSVRPISSKEIPMISIETIQKSFDLFYQSILRGLTLTTLDDVRLSHCQLTEQESTQLLKTVIPSAEEWITEVFLKTGRYKRDETGVLVDEAQQIRSTFYQLAKWIGPNETHLTSELEQNLMGLLTMLNQSTEGAAFYLDELMDEVREGGDVAQIQTLSFLFQLQAKQTFLQAFSRLN